MEELILNRIKELEPRVEKAFLRIEKGEKAKGEYNFIVKTYQLNIMIYNRISKRSFEQKFWKIR